MMIVLVTDIGEWVSARILFLKIPTAFLGSREIAYVCSVWAMDQSLIRIREKSCGYKDLLKLKTNIRFCFL